MKSSPLHVLLADDDEDDAFLFREALKKIPLDVQLSVVYNGCELMDFLLKARSVPFCLFLDVNMPRKNGFECLSEIKSNPKLRALPVIIYTTAYQREVAETFHKVGAAHYLRKPSDFTKLCTAIHETITLIEDEVVSRRIVKKFVLPTV